MHLIHLSIFPHFFNKESCFPKFTDVTCNPALDDIEGEYPFEVINKSSLLFDNLFNIKASMQN